jgi:hypothetical protein
MASKWHGDVLAHCGRRSWLSIGCLLLRNPSAIIAHADEKVNSASLFRSRIRRITDFGPQFRANSIWHVSSSADQSKSILAIKKPQKRAVFPTAPVTERLPATSSPVPDREGTQMRYNPEALPRSALPLVAYQLLEADPGIGVSAKTVRELRKVTEWPGNLVITTRQDRHGSNAITLGKASAATRVSPKT